VTGGFDSFVVMAGLDPAIFAAVVRLREMPGSAARHD
jgi:hypothetical protein